jgi:hypothetical protein
LSCIIYWLGAVVFHYAVLVLLYPVGPWLCGWY